METTYWQRVCQDQSVRELVRAHLMILLAWPLIIWLRWPIHPPAIALWFLGVWITFLYLLWSISKHWRARKNLVRPFKSTSWWAAVLLYPVLGFMFVDPVIWVIAMIQFLFTWQLADRLIAIHGVTGVKTTSTAWGG